MRSAARLQACRTVVWSRPPKRAPDRRAASARCARARGTWRPGAATRRAAARLGDESSSRVSAEGLGDVAAWMRSTSSGPAARRRAAAGRGRRGPRRRASAVIGRVGQRGVGDDADQRALERAHVVGDALGDELERRRSSARSMPSWWTRLRRTVRRVARSGGAMSATQAGLEALAQAVLERVEVARQAVGGEHELAAGSCSALKVWKNSSSVLALRSRNWTSSMSRTSMRAEARLEGVDRRRRAAPPTNSLVKRLDGRVADGQAAAVGAHVVADRVQQVRLADAGRAVDEQRVVGLARAARRRPARRRGRGGWRRR